MTTHKISLQFHCNPNEALDLVSGVFNDPIIWVTKEDKKVVNGRFEFCYTNIAVSERENFKIGQEGVCLYFTTEKPVLTENQSGFDFCVENPNYLSCTIGALTEEGLEESWLATMTTNESIFATWKKLIDTSKKHMQSGAIALNIKTQTTSVLKNYWHTKGAFELFKKGVPIKTLAPLVVLRFE